MYFISYKNSTIWDLDGIRSNLSAMTRKNDAARAALREIVQKGRDKDKNGNLLEPRVVRALNSQAFASMADGTFRSN